MTTERMARLKGRINWDWMKFAKETFTMIVKAIVILWVAATYMNNQLHDIRLGVAAKETADSLKVVKADKVALDKATAELDTVKAHLAAFRTDQIIEHNDIKNDQLNQWDATNRVERKNGMPLTHPRRVRE